MRNMPWIVGLGVLALALVGWAFPRRQKSPWVKTMKWGKMAVVPMQKWAIKSGKRVKGLVR